MKKIIVMLLCAILLFSIPYAAFAENTVAIKSVTVSADTVTVNFDTEGLTEEDSVTVLTYKSDKITDEPTEANIKYIDQITKESKTSISFSLNEAASGVYQIKMGGTDVAANAAVSVSVEEGMSDTIHYMNNSLSVFSKPVGSFGAMTRENNQIYILKPSVNYIAAYSSVPSLDGYTVKEYGIRINGNDYEAKVALKADDSRFGILFSDVPDEITVTAYPYIVYENSDGAAITYYGTAYVDTINYTAQ